MRHLRAIIYDESFYSKWSSDQIPLVMRIFNSEEKTRTGVSPAEILFGNSVDLNRNLLFKSSSSDVDLHPYLEQMLERQSALIKVAQETQREFDIPHEQE